MLFILQVLLALNDQSLLHLDAQRRNFIAIINVFQECGNVITLTTVMTKQMNNSVVRLFSVIEMRINIDKAF
jgi:hypothetical protein